MNPAPVQQPGQTLQLLESTLRVIQSQAQAPDFAFRRSLAGRLLAGVSVPLPESPTGQWVKRLLDVVIAGCLVAATWPVMLICAVAIRLDSLGPVLFCQERVGRHGRIFTLVKFRTMVVDAEAACGPVWAQTQDTRVTRLGAFLRKTHLDEFPQLFNVLRGEMSLIGPRPERPHFVHQFQRQAVLGYRYRHSVRPGITGYAQLNCPHPTIETIQAKTDMDNYYITHWSLWLDCWLSFKTAAYFARSIIMDDRRERGNLR